MMKPTPLDQDPSDAKHAPDKSASPPQYLRRGILRLVILLGVLLAASWLCVHLDIDRRVAGRFFDPTEGWAWRDAPPWYWFYRFGTLPGLALTLGALILWAVSWTRPRLRHWHRYWLLIVLTSVIGAGLIVNGVLKPYWGRPRPGQVQEFGGQWEYREWYQPGIPGKGASFPCGHCTMGFIFVPLFFFHRVSRRIAWIGGGFGVVAGTVLSATRIVQGAHFVTDTLWSLGVILIVASLLYDLILRIPTPRADHPQAMTPQRKGLMIIGITAAAILIALLFMTRRPFYKTHHYAFAIDPQVQTILVTLNLEPDQTQIRYTANPQGHIYLHARGFGWLKASDGIALDTRMEGSQLIFAYQVQPVGYFAELEHQVELALPQTLADTIAVAFQHDAP